MFDINSDPSLSRNVYRLRGVVRDILSEMLDSRKGAEAIRLFARSAVKAILEDFESAAERAAAADPPMLPETGHCSRCSADSSVVLGDEPLCGRCYSVAV